MNGSNHRQEKRPQYPSRPLLPERNASRQTTHIPYTAEEQERIQSQLNKVLGPEYVSFRPGGGGQNVSYIEGWKALNLANEIFGFNGWSSELVNVQVDFLDSLGSGRVSLGLSVVVRITIRDGTFHEDFGYGFLENAKNKAVAFEKCKKEAFTDGLKRCLRCFGNVLGNCLYDKTIVAKMQKVKLPTPELNSDDFHRDPLLARQELARRKMLQNTNRVSIREQNGANSESTPLAQSPMTAGADFNRNGVSGANGSLALESKLHQSVPSTPSLHNQQQHVQNQEQKHQQQQSTMHLNRNIANNSGPAKALTSVELGKYDLDDFDDLFEFSDDLPVGVDESNLDFEMKIEDETMPPLSELLDNSEGNDPNKVDTPMPAQVFFTSSKKALELQNTPNQSEVPVYDHKFVAEGVKRTVDPTKSAKIKRSDLPSAYTASQINSTRPSSVGVVPSITKRQLGLPQSQRIRSKRLHKGPEPPGKENDAT